eukprot:m.203081 g.203081  ORF g.203081 m.203081 type:complete len:149 (+) comp18449_c0_seq6:61-507(+)
MAEATRDLVGAFVGSPAEYAAASLEPLDSLNALSTADPDAQNSAVAALASINEKALSVLAEALEHGRAFVHGGGKKLRVLDLSALAQETRALPTLPVDQQCVQMQLWQRVARFNKALFAKIDHTLQNTRVWCNVLGGLRSCVVVTFVT